MKRLSMVLLGAGLFAARCHAQGGSEGSQEHQSCRPGLVQWVSEQLKLPDSIGTEEGGDSGTSTVIAAACKSNPADREQTYVALAYDAGDKDAKRLVLTVVEGDRVVADYRDKMPTTPIYRTC
jgi:hypothetical protein